MAMFSQHVLLQEGLLAYGEGGALCDGGVDSTKVKTLHHVSLEPQNLSLVFLFL